MLNKLIKLFPIFLIVCIAAYSYKKYRIAPRISFPTIEVINEKNEIVKLGNTSGKIRVISFYASWCPDCKLEFPKMLSAMKTTLPQVEFFAITDEGIEKMIWFQKTSKYPFTFYTLPKSFEHYDISAIPTTYILNSKNEIMYSKVGNIDWSNKEFILSLIEN